jgi:hypothetical protein
VLLNILQQQVEVQRKLVELHTKPEHSDVPEPEFNTWDVRTWGLFLDEGEIGFVHLRTQLRLDYSVTPSATLRRRTALDNVVQWARSAAEVELWDQGETVKTGQRLLEALRDVVADEKGIAVEDIHAKLRKVRSPNDHYGRAMDEAARKGHGKTTDGKTKKKAQCRWCGKTGHFEATCYAKREGKPRTTDGGAPATSSRSNLGRGLAPQQ